MTRGLAGLGQGPLALLVCAVVLVTGVGLAAALSATDGGGDARDRPRSGAALGADQPGATPAPGGPVITPGVVADEVPARRMLTCPPVTVRVTTADELSRALRDAVPGDVVGMADGTYAGRFEVTAPGTAAAPVWLCGGRGAVLDGEGLRKGYGLHLDGVAHWRLVGFTVTNSQKGVVADRVTQSVIQGLLVHDIGDEAIHLRAISTGNSVQGNTIRRTGLRRDKFGEGVYIGSAEGNWAQYGNDGPDRSDFNLVWRNDIALTGAECVDVKEGTTGGVVAANTFDGAGMIGADSWVDVKGNGWVVEGNTGRTSPMDGFQTHELADGWGTGNVFRHNVVMTPVPGVAVKLHKHGVNRVE